MKAIYTIWTIFLNSTALITALSQGRQTAEIPKALLPLLNHSALTNEISSGNSNWLHVISKHLYSVPLLPCDSDEKCSSTNGKCKDGFCECKLPHPVLHLQSQRCLSATYSEGGYCEYTIQCFQYDMKCINFMCTKNYSDVSFLEKPEFKYICIVGILALIIVAMFIKDRFNDCRRQHAQRRQIRMLEEQNALIKPESHLPGLPSYEEAVRGYPQSQGSLVTNPSIEQV